MLIVKKGYKGTRHPIGKVLNRDLNNPRKGWTNINIDKEITEYEELGIVPNF